MSLNGLYTEEPDEIGELNMSSLAVDAQPTAAVTACNEERWADEITNQQHVRDANTKLDSRIRDFLSYADPAEVDSLQRSREEFMQVLQKAKEQQLEHAPEKEPGSKKTLRERIREGCTTITETAYTYTQMLDVMVGQAPEYVALAYGAIKIILVIQINYTELKVKVREYMDHIKGKFEVIDHLTAYIPTAHMVNAVSQAYTLFSRFLAKAVKHYMRSRIKSYIRAVIKPWKKFEDIVSSIDQTFIRIREIANYNGLLTTHANLAIGRANLDMVNQLAVSHKNMSLMIENLSDHVKAITVQFSRPQDVQETATLLCQRMGEELEQPLIHEESIVEAADDETSKITKPGDGNNDLSSLLSDGFIELKSYNNDSAGEMKAVNELPEMKAHRSKQRNLLRLEKVMSWIEADTSQASER